MRKNVSGLLSQFGFGVGNDLLAAIIVITLFAASLGVLALAGAL